MAQHELGSLRSLTFISIEDTIRLACANNIDHDADCIMVTRTMHIMHIIMDKALQHHHRSFTGT